MRNLLILSVVWIISFTCAYSQSSLSRRFSYIGEPNADGYRVVGLLKTVTVATGSYTNYSAGTRTVAYERSIIGMRYGVVNAKGNMVVSVRYESISLIGNEARASKNNKIRIIHLKERKSSPKSWILSYNFVGEPWDGMTLVEKNGKYGYVNEEGKEIISPAYDDLSPYATAYIPAKKGKYWGFITRDNNVAIDFKYQQTAYLKDYLLEKANGKWAFIDPSGQYYSQFEYDSIIVNWQSELTRVKKNGYWGLIDFSQQGKEILPVEYDSIGRFNDSYARSTWQNFSQDRNPYVALAPVKKDGKYGYVNGKGKFVVPVLFESYTEACFNSDLILLKHKGKYGYMNGEGQIVIPFEYDSASCDRHKEGFFAIRGTKRGLVKYDGTFTPLQSSDPYYVTGDFKLKNVYDKMETFNYAPGGNLDMAKVHKDGKVGSVDRAGNELVPPIYDDVSGSFMPSEAYWNYKVFRHMVLEPDAQLYTPVKINEKWGVVNRDNQLIVEPQYTSLTLYTIRKTKSLFAYVVKDGKKGIIDMQDNKVIQIIYEDIYESIGGPHPFESDDAAAVKQDGKWGFVNRKGEVIIPFKYDKAYNFDYFPKGSKARVRLGNKEFNINIKGRRTK